MPEGHDRQRAHTRSAAAVGACCSYLPAKNEACGQRDRKKREKERKKERREKEKKEEREKERGRQREKERERERKEGERKERKRKRKKEGEERSGILGSRHALRHIGTLRITRATTCLTGIHVGPARRAGSALQERKTRHYEIKLQSYRTDFATVQPGGRRGCCRRSGRARSDRGRRRRPCSWCRPVSWS